MYIIHSSVGAVIKSVVPVSASAGRFPVDALLQLFSIFVLFKQFFSFFKKEY